MHDTQSVEEILSRLMPTALSEEGQRDIETMLDELATTATGPALVEQSRPHLWPLVGGIAAALIAMAAISYSINPASSSIIRTAKMEVPFFELLSESDRVENIQDDGWRESPEGSAMRAMRLRVVEENTLLDSETGIVMQISEPRDELLLMPVSAF